MDKETEQALLDAVAYARKPLLNSDICAHTRAWWYLVARLGYFDDARFDLPMTRQVGMGLTGVGPDLRGGER